jgi:hypothetical protein
MSCKKDVGGTYLSTKEHTMKTEENYPGWRNVLDEAVENVVLPGRMVDNGFGHHEYMGAPGYHSSMQFECDEVVSVEIAWFEASGYDDGPERELMVQKAVSFGPNDQSDVIEVRVRLDKASVVRRPWGGSDWTATYSVGE